MAQGAHHSHTGKSGAMSMQYKIFRVWCWAAKLEPGYVLLIIVVVTRPTASKYDTEIGLVMMMVMRAAVSACEASSNASSSGMTCTRNIHHHHCCLRVNSTTRHVMMRVQTKFPTRASRLYYY